MARQREKVQDGGAVRVRIDLVDAALRPASQMRECLDAGAVAEYAAILDELPPVRLVWDQGQYWVADGAHTITAARQAGQEDIRAIVANGSYVDAFRDASRCNAGRGVRLREGDKQHRIREFLGRPEAKGMTQQQVADVCNADQGYVSKVKSRNYDSHNSQDDTPASRPGRGRPRKSRPEPARERPAAEDGRRTVPIEYPPEKVAALNEWSGLVGDLQAHYDAVLALLRRFPADERGEVLDKVHQLFHAVWLHVPRWSPSGSEYEFDHAEPPCMVRCQCRLHDVKKY
jgi:hypothetical protein